MVVVLEYDDAYDKDHSDLHCDCKTHVLCSHPHELRLEIHERQAIIRVFFPAGQHNGIARKEKTQYLKTKSKKEPETRLTSQVTLV